jgi:exosortase
MLAVYLFHGIVWQTLDSFSNPLGNVSHGWIILVIAAHALWKQKGQLQKTSKNYSFLGIFCVIVVLAIHLLSKRSLLLYPQQLLFITLLWSLAYSVWGWQVAKLLIFPVWYLVFTISIPVTVEELVLKLQHISSTSVFYVMNGLGFEVFQSGNALSSVAEDSEFQFLVAGSCSGIRSLTALTAFAAAYAWYTQRNMIKKWLLFAIAIPIAILCNIIRVFSICLVAFFWGQNTAIGYYHDYSGYIIVLIGILLIFQCDGLMRSLHIGELFPHHALT